MKTWHSFLLLVVAPAALLIPGGCDRNTSETVNISEPAGQPAPGAATGGQHEHGDAVIAYKLPEGWTEEPGGANMRYATLKGPDDAQIAVTVFGNAAGMTNIANVNRWRGQMALDPIDESQLDQNLSQVQTAGPTALMTDIKSSDGSQRMLAAIIPDEGKSWYLKFQGPTDTITKHADAFNRILKSVTLEHDHAH